MTAPTLTFQRVAHVLQNRMGFHVEPQENRLRAQTPRGLIVSIHPHDNEAFDGIQVIAAFEKPEGIDLTQLSKITDFVNKRYPAISAFLTDDAVMLTTDILAAGPGLVPECDVLEAILPQHFRALDHSVDGYLESCQVVRGVEAEAEAEET